MIFEQNTSPRFTFCLSVDTRMGSFAKDSSTIKSSVDMIDKGVGNVTGVVEPYSVIFLCLTVYTIWKQVGKKEKRKWT
jgi:hypothetical protein